MTEIEAEKNKQTKTHHLCFTSIISIQVKFEKIKKKRRHLSEAGDWCASLHHPDNNMISLRTHFSFLEMLTHASRRQTGAL